MADMDYMEIFGGGAPAAHFALQDRDLQRAKTQQTMAFEQENIKQQQLANLFAEQNNPLKLQQQQLANETAGYTNRQQAVTTDIAEKTAAQKLNSEQQKYILSAKQSDLDGMEIEAQRMAYSPDPALREQGVQMLQMHKDFIKLREDQKFRSSERVAGEKHDFALEAQRARSAQALEGTRQSGKAALKAQAGGGIKNVFDAVQSGKVSPDKAAVAFGSAMLQAQASGDMETAAQYQQAAALMEELALKVKPDSQAGKTVITPEGTLGTNPPRQPTFQAPRQQLGAPQPSLPSGWTMK